jgi:hypothetical protein
MKKQLRWVRRVSCRGAASYYLPIRCWNGGSIANPKHHYIWGGLNYQFIADYIEKRNLSKKCGDLRFIVTQEKECCLILSFKVRTPLDHTCLPKSQQMNILPANAYRTGTYTYRSHIICAV